MKQRMLCTTAVSWRGRRHNFWRWLHAWHRQGRRRCGCGCGSVSVTHVHVLTSPHRVPVQRASQRFAPCAFMRHARAIDAPMRVHDARPHSTGMLMSCGSRSCPSPVTWHGLWLDSASASALPAGAHSKEMSGCKQIVTAQGRKCWLSQPSGPVNKSTGVVFVSSPHHPSRFHVDVHRILPVLGLV